MKLVGEGAQLYNVTKNGYNSAYRVLGHENNDTLPDPRFDSIFDKNCRKRMIQIFSYFARITLSCLIRMYNPETYLRFQRHKKWTIFFTKAKAYEGLLFGFRLIRKM